MAIKISRQLTQEQYIKLFSNPISGIACEVDSYNRDHRVKWCCQNIRYSKSMILGALNFWYNYNLGFYKKIKKIYHPVIDLLSKLQLGLDGLTISYWMIDKYPDSYLFSHRYISKIPDSKYNQGIKIQKKLLQDKLGIKMIEFQEQSVQPYYIMYDYERSGIEFTVFPNEHPYIHRAVIAEVGQTKQGNVFVIKK